MLRFHLHPIAVAILGAFVFAAAMATSGAMVSVFASPPHWLGQVLFKLVLLVLSLGVGLTLTRGSLAALGVQRPVAPRWGRMLLPGSALGASTSLLMISLDLPRMKALEDYSLLQMVLVVWLWSSLTEEVFARGLLQSALEPWRNIAIYGINVPILTAAAVFGGMHITLLFYGTALSTTILIMGSTFLLGLAAGHARQQTRSLLPAVATHVAFNLFGVVGAIFGVLLRYLWTGELPTP